MAGGRFYRPIMPKACEIDGEAGPAMVTLTTDFGLEDWYVAAMKAAVLRCCGRARLVDVTHGVRRGDIVGGSICVERAVDAFGAGTVHLAVVDPGVGTGRRLLIAKIKEQLVVCPDNGLITWAWRRQGGGVTYELTWRPERVSETFHGRDIMGPAAGMLAGGSATAEELGRLVDDPVLLDMAPVKPPGRAGRIIHLDRFGNAMTNILEETVRAVPEARVRVGGRDIGRLRRTYAEVGHGEPAALIGSSGLLEIAVRDGSAEEKLGLCMGDEVIIG